MLDTVVISDKDACCSVVFGTLVGVPVFSVIWSELLLTSAINCPLWSSVYECQIVECAYTSPVRAECGMLAMCFIVCPCQLFLWCVDMLSREDVYSLTIVFSVVNMYFGHLKFCFVYIMVECMSVVVNVILSLRSGMSPPLKHQAPKTHMPSSTRIHHEHV